MRSARRKLQVSVSTRVLAHIYGGNGGTKERQMKRGEADDSPLNGRVPKSSSGCRNPRRWNLVAEAGGGF